MARLLVLQPVDKVSAHGVVGTRVLEVEQTRHAPAAHCLRSAPLGRGGSGKRRPDVNFS